jgi:hypothetical protein
MAFVVMCAEKIRRLLRLFFVIINAWFYAFKRSGRLWMALRDCWGGLRLENYCSLHNRPGKRPTTALVVAQNRESLLSIFSGVPNSVLLSSKKIFGLAVVYDEWLMLQTW